MEPDKLEEITARANAALRRLSALSAESGIRFLVGDVADLVIEDLPAGIEINETLKGEVVEVVLSLMAGGPRSS